jgi:hypothetical protein
MTRPEPRSPHLAIPLGCLVVLAIAGCAALDKAADSTPSERLADLRVDDLRAGALRGYQICADDRDCGEQRSARSAPASAPPADLDVRLLRGSAGQHGPALTTPALMGPGDAFAFRLSTQRGGHVYLWHLAPSGELTELVSRYRQGVSGDCRVSNRLAPGEILLLPAPGEHFALDDSPGTERFFPIIGAMPLCPGNPMQTIGTAARAPADCSDPRVRCAAPVEIRRAHAL